MSCGFTFGVPLGLCTRVVRRPAADHGFPFVAQAIRPKRSKTVGRPSRSERRLPHDPPGSRGNVIPHPQACHTPIQAHRHEQDPKWGMRGQIEHNRNELSRGNFRFYCRWPLTSDFADPLPSKDGRGLLELAFSRYFQREKLPEGRTSEHLTWRVIVDTSCVCL